MKTYLCCLLCVCCFALQGLAQKRTTELGLNVTTTLAGFFNSGGETLIDPYIISLKTGRKNRFFRMGATFKVKSSLPLDFSTILLTKEQDYNIRLGFERRVPITKRFRMHWGVDFIVQYSLDSTESRANSNPILFKTWEVGGGGGPILGIAYIFNEKMYISTEGAIYGVYRQGKADLFGGATIENRTLKSFVLNPIIPNSLYFNFSF